MVSPDFSNQKREPNAMRTKILSLLALVVIATVASIFFFAQRDNSVRTTLRIGYIPIADCAQLYIAIERGFFADENINTELVSLAGGAKILEALGSKSIDIGFSNVVSLIFARNAGLPFIALTGGPVEDTKHPEHAILVRRDSRFNSVADLSGSRITLNTRRNIDELMVSLLLEKHGIDLSKVTFIEVPFPRMLGVLAAGDVDAIAAIEPFVTFGTQDGSNRILTYNYLDIQPRTEISTYVVGMNWLASNEDTAHRFQRAMTRATRFANQNPDYVREILVKYTRLTAEQFVNVQLPAFTEELTPELLQEMISRMATRGWIREEFSATSLIHETR